MELFAVTGFLDIKNGEVQGGDKISGLVGQRAPRSADRNRQNDILFIHITLFPALSDQYDILAEDLVDAFSTFYFRTGGTVNSAMRQATRHINGLLLKWNMSNDSVSREAAITSVVYKNDEIYIVQAGPSLALMGHNFGLEKIPTNEPDRITPLGQGVNLDFRFEHYRIQEGVQFLLVDPWLAVIPTTTLEGALAYNDVESSLADLSDIAADQPLKVVMVRFTSDPPQLYKDSKFQIELLNNKSARPTLGMGRAKRNRRAGELEATIDPDATVVSGMGMPMREGQVESLEEFDSSADETAQSVELNIPEMPKERSEWPTMAAISIFVPMLMALLFFGLYIRNEGNEQRSQLLEQMAATQILAEEETDPALKRARFLQVLELGELAVASGVTEPEVRNIQESARRKLDEMDGIFRLEAQLLHQYEGENVALTSIVGQSSAIGDGFYVLDGGSQAVYFHQTGTNLLPAIETGTPTVVATADRAIGAYAIGQFVDMMWRPLDAQNPREALAILDNRGAIVSYFPEASELRVIQLGMSSAWRHPLQINEYGGNLYVLDDAAGYVWRYYPSNGNYVIQEERQAITFYDSPNIEESVDFVIDDSDGSVLFLYQDGTLLKYYNGRTNWTPETLARNGLQSPMLDPKAIKYAGEGNTASLFVLDPGSNRILQLSRSGVLLNQFRATGADGRELIPQAIDFAVTQNPTRFVIITETEVYFAE